jgi:hypothetical protein
MGRKLPPSRRKHAGSRGWWPDTPAVEAAAFMDRFTGSCELIRRVAKTLAWANLEIVVVAVGPDPPNADPREWQEAIAGMYQTAQAAGLQIRPHGNMLDPG